eukprot:350255-Chlamydomonas_euryale.AAC.19
MTLPSSSGNARLVELWHSGLHWATADSPARALAVGLLVGFAAGLLTAVLVACVHSQPAKRSRVYRVR